MLMSWVDNIFTSQGNDRMIGKFISSKTSENVCFVLRKKRLTDTVRTMIVKISIWILRKDRTTLGPGAMAPPKFF